MPQSSNRRFFLCTGKAITIEWLQKHPGSHIIGELLHVMDEGIMVTALAVYECSLPITSPPETIPAVRVEIVGDARRIRCTCCDRGPRWEIGRAAVRSVLKKYNPE